MRGDTHSRPLKVRGSALTLLSEILFICGAAIMYSLMPSSSGTAFCVLQPIVLVADGSSHYEMPYDHAISLRQYVAPAYGRVRTQCQRAVDRAWQLAGNRRDESRCAVACDVELTGLLQ